MRHEVEKVDDHWCKGMKGKVKSTCSPGTNSGMSLVVQRKVGCSATIILLLEGEVKMLGDKTKKCLLLGIYDALLFTSTSTYATPFDYMTRKSTVGGRPIYYIPILQNEKVQTERLRVCPS